MGKKIIAILVILVLALGICGIFFAANTATATTINSVSGEEQTTIIDNQAEQLQAKKTKELKNKKIRAIKKTNKLYKKYKFYLSSKQINKIKRVKNNIHNANTKSKITKEFNKVKNLIKKIKKHYNYVVKWTKRINNYLSGSPTAGCGKYYAEAAWQNNIDPRWAPAISCVESGKGAAYISGTYNVWGWGCGSISLGSSWKTAIYNYVAKLKAGYGSALTMWAACKYCSSEWYSVCANEISKI